jgi:hypothetical protein
MVHGVSARRTVGGLAREFTLKRDLMQNEEISAVLTHSAWKGAPAERDARYFRTWQKISVALQGNLRARIPELYFRDDLTRYEDRDAAYQLVVYEAGRMFYGRPKTEFTFDVADSTTLPAVLRTIGRPMRTVLGRIQKRLFEAGRPELARRYSPVWHHDILGVVLDQPKRLVGLLAAEAKLINAVIDLGTARNAAAVNRFSKTASASLRSVCGQDMRELDVGILEETERRLGVSRFSLQAGQDLPFSRALENGRVRTARSPDHRIGCEKDSDHRGSDGRGEVGDAGVVAEIHSSGGKPARKAVQIADTHGSFQQILRTSAPFDRHIEPRGDRAERIKRPVFSRAS